MISESTPLAAAPSLHAASLPLAHWSQKLSRVSFSRDGVGFLTSLARWQQLVSVEVLLGSDILCLPFLRLPGCPGHLGLAIDELRDIGEVLLVELPGPSVILTKTIAAVGTAEPFMKGGGSAIGRVLALVLGVPLLLLIELQFVLYCPYLLFQGLQQTLPLHVFINKVIE